MEVLIGLLIIAVAALTLVTVHKARRGGAAAERCSSIKAKDDVLLI